MTEGELQAAVVEMARMFGWAVAHFRPARTQKGWRTAVAYDGKGFPDLVLVRERVVWVELKGDGGRLSEDQHRWRRLLEGASQERYVWTPAEWLAGNVDRVLAPVGAVWAA